MIKQEPQDFISKTHHVVQYERSKLSNKVAIILSLIAFPYIFIFYSYSKFLSIFIIPIIGLFLSVIIFNKQQKYSFANYILIISSVLSATFYSACFGQNTDIHLLLYAYIGLPFILFELKDKKNICLASTVPFFCLLYLEYSNFYSPITLTLEQDISNLIHTTATFVVYGLITLYFWFFTISNNFHISQLIKTNQELQKSKDDNEILAQQTAHSRLVRGIAHEIKNPIGAMFTRADFIREDPETTPAVMKFCNIVMEACDRLSRLTEAMLRYGGNSTVNQTTFDAKEMVENVMIISTGFKEKNIALSADLDEGLAIYGNTDFIHSVVQNLLANALQYTDEGSVSISAKAATYMDPNGTERDGVCIRVVDTGTGIPEDQIDKIFDPYFTSKNSSTNMGLGLSFVYKTVVESLGKIEVSSVVGEGSTFVVYLPGADPRLDSR